MAITNAQQYQQLVNKPADGKRPGYRGDAAYRSFSAQSTGSQRGSATRSEVGGGKSRDNEPSLRDDPTVPQATRDSRDDEVFQKRQQLKKEALRQEEEKREELIERFRNKQFTGLPFPGVTSLLNPLFQKGMRVNRNFFLDKVLGAGRLGDLTPEEFAKLSLSEQEAAYKDYMSNRLAGKTDAYGNPTRGFSYDSEGNLVGNFIDDGGSDSTLPFIPKDDEDDTTTPPPKQILTSRIIGSQFEPTMIAADGGIMNNDIVGGMMDGNMDEMGRQMYGLGKLVKKATRAVKKIVKSPIGKAALLYGVGAMGGSFGNTGRFFSKGMFNPGNIGRGLFGISAKGQALRGFPELAAKKGLFGKLGLTSGYGGLMPTVKGGITLAGILPFILKGDDEDKFDIEEYYKQGKIANVPLNKRIAGSDFYAADGGLMRAGYQEGGDAEPVAKKTMPLIDMDGMEKDYRETGGFVEMGRMERADDVPARLSKNEFVFTADAVRNAGDGDIDKGAEVMYNMMKNLEDGGDVSEESQGLEGARNMFQTSQRLGEVL